VVKEGLEDPGPCVRVHARSGVGDPQHHVRAADLSRVLRGVPLVEVDGGRLDRDPSAVRHGIPGVDDEIDDHLLDLAPIGLDETGILGGREDELERSHRRELVDPSGARR